ncbi:Methyltransferase-like protein 21D [Dissophora globulifera]|nr:Methyltransferase-like protein 21D [Dissophora globulifera]
MDRALCGPYMGRDTRGGVGSTIWDAAIVLSKYLEKSALISLTSSASRPINVLELGSGTGIVGLAVARILSDNRVMAGSRVVLTDKDNVLPLLQRNVEKNASAGISIEARILDWEAVSGVRAPGSSVEATREKVDAISDSIPRVTYEDIVNVDWDLVIVSDCIWVPELYGSLIGAINTIISPRDKTQLVVAFEKRNFSEEMEFFAMLGKTFRFRDIKPEEQDGNYQSEDIFLFICQRRHIEN